jgi:hypothetical protein
MDYTFDTYRKILEVIKSQGYNVQTFFNYISNVVDKRNVILRHDVDRFPKQALKMAQLEAECGIHSTYYFRTIPSVFKPDILLQIADLGNEIGYHYEDLTICRGDKKKAIISFEDNLYLIQKYYPVKTICMHGSPLSKWDNKTLWNYYDYRKYGIIADTSMDIDYNKVFYITDNGRGWNNIGVSVRDKVATHFNIPIRNSTHLIELVNTNKLPDNIMINAHPDTFFNFGMEYILNWGFIETKNLIKRIIVRYKLIK